MKRAERELPLEIKFSIVAECPNCGNLLSPSDIREKECEACLEKFKLPKRVPGLSWSTVGKTVSGKFNWNPYTVGS